MNRSAELQFGQIRRAKDTLIAPGWSPALQFRGSWSECMRKSERRLSMNQPAQREVLECASPLALSDLVRGRKSGRRLPQSKTLARQRPPCRGSWSQCVIIKPRRLSMNRPTPGPSQEGNRQSSTP